MKNIFRNITKFQPAVYGGIYLTLIPLFAFGYFFAPDILILCNKESCGFAQAIYYSVVTITTLGYGDIIPGNTKTQMLAALEALIGVITIGLFLNSLSHRLSQEAQSTEKAKDEENKRQTALARLRSHNTLVNLYIDRYLRYTAPITVPISKRNTINGTGEIVFDVNPNFVFSDMKDLFKTTFFLTDNRFKPTVVYYFEAQTELLKAIIELVQGVELTRWPHLEGLCLTFIRNCKQLDFSEHILGQPNSLVGDKKGSEFDEEMIEQFKGPVEFKLSHSINPYIGLYMLIKENINFVNQYKAETSKILSSN